MINFQKVLSIEIQYLVKTSATTAKVTILFSGLQKTTYSTLAAKTCTVKAFL